MILARSKAGKMWGKCAQRGVFCSKMEAEKVSAERRVKYPSLVFVLNHKDTKTSPKIMNA